MTYSATWTADALRNAGLTVIEVPGWKTRGTREMGEVKGVLCHHTGSMHKGGGNYPSKGTILHGRPGLCGPLAQLGLGRDGTWFTFAAGRCNHAGLGVWKGVVTGNTNFLGVEAENSGFIHGPEAEPWPEVQMESYAKGVAALLNHIGADESWAVGHREFARPKGRKTDPTFDMDDFREKVAKYQKELSK